MYVILVTAGLGFDPGGMTSLLSLFYSCVVLCIGQCISDTVNLALVHNNIIHAIFFVDAAFRRGSCSIVRRERKLVTRV
jgi:hypothetical protein